MFINKSWPKMGRPKSATGTQTTLIYSHLWRVLYSINCRRYPKVLVWEKCSFFFVQFCWCRCTLSQKHDTTPAWGMRHSFRVSVRVQHDTEYICARKENTKQNKRRERENKWKLLITLHAAGAKLCGVSPFVVVTGRRAKTVDNPISRVWARAWSKQKPTRQRGVYVI